MSYQLTWITSQLAVGYAPMSYTELDHIREQGIDAIVNLCGEFCDLHDIEEKSGFEVYYLPIPDECAPDMELMEKALAWLDEAVYLGKNVLVHCRYGHGRTGTFVSAYLLRRGHGLKVTEKTLKGTRANPTNYQQWKLLREYRKKVGRFTLVQPRLENRRTVDLTPFFQDYEALVQEVDRKCEELGHVPACGRETDACCRKYFDLQLIEAIYLNNSVNRKLKSGERTLVIERAVKTADLLKRLKPGESGQDGAQEGENSLAEKYLCPVSVDAKCIMFNYRPVRCRCYGLPDDGIGLDRMESMLAELSREVFFSLAGCFLPPAHELRFSMADTVSGRFVQIYFQYMVELSR